jgi:hypothetical protein
MSLRRATPAAISSTRQLQTVGPLLSLVCNFVLCLFRCLTDHISQALHLTTTTPSLFCHQKTGSRTSTRSSKESLSGAESRRS